MLSVLRGNLKFKYLFFFNEYSYLQPFLHVERAFELQEFSVSFPATLRPGNTAFQHLKFGYELLCQHRVFLGAC